MRIKQLFNKIEKNFFILIILIICCLLYIIPNFNEFYNLYVGKDQYLEEVVNEKIYDIHQYSKKINFGLDLKGGVRFLLKIDTNLMQKKK